MSDEEVSHGIALGTITIELYVDDQGDEVYRFDVDGMSHLQAIGLLEQVKFDRLLIQDEG